MKETMISAAIAAGDILKKHYGKQLVVELKGEKGLVSQVDKEAEVAILSILQEKFDYNVFAEESGKFETDSEYCWVIDPLDGTTNYINQISFFCVSIALLKNNQPEAAVIYHPLNDELFYARKDKGAYLNGNKLEIRKNSRSVVIDCNFGYEKESGIKYLEALKNILPYYSNIRNLGSSALELAYLAAGKVDCFITYGDELYDVAAGILIAEESGCKVSNWNGDPWKTDSKDILVAPQPLHSEISKCISNLI